MPASTFTLAVGHWLQVSGEIPPALEKKLKDSMDCGKRPKPGTGAGQQTEAGLVSSLGSSTTEVVEGSTVQTGRYFIIFPVFFSSYKTSSSPDCY